MPPAGVSAQSATIHVEPVIQEKPTLKKFHVPEPEVFEDAPIMTALVAYLNLGLLVIFGYIRDFMRLFGYECYRGAKEWGNEVKLFNYRNACTFS